MQVFFFLKLYLAWCVITLGFLTYLNVKAYCKIQLLSQLVAKRRRDNKIKLKGKYLSFRLAAVPPVFWFVTFREIYKKK